MGITEGNKLIAEFAGWEDKVYQSLSPDVSTNFSNSYKRFDSPDGKISLSYYYDDFSEALKYHTSWDWLMPVVEMIESLGFSVVVNNEGAYIKKWFHRGNVPDFGKIAETKIEALWSLTVEFIQWYNNKSIK